MIILPSLIFKIHANRLSSEDLRKSKSALRRAFKKLRESNVDQFTNTSNIVYGYLKDKIQLPSDKLDPLKVKSILNQKITDKSIINNLIFLDKLSGLFDSHSKPVNSSMTKSGIPDMRVVITGTPDNIDSINTTGMPSISPDSSFLHAKTKTSNDLIQTGTSTCGTESIQSI